MVKEKLHMDINGNGYSLLNEYGIYKLNNDKKKRIKTSTEKDIFDVLGMEYLTPDKRT